MVPHFFWISGNARETRKHLHEVDRTPFFVVKTRMAAGPTQLDTSENDEGIREEFVLAVLSSFFPCFGDRPQSYEAVGFEDRLDALGRVVVVGREACEERVRIDSHGVTFSS